MPQAMTDISVSLDPIPPARFGALEARRLLLRVGFGGSPERIAALVELGPEAAVDSLLSFPADSADADAPIRPGVIHEPTQAERRAFHRARSARDENALAQLRARRQTMQRADRRQLAEMQTWWLDRMIDSPTPAREKLTLFWHGHFATSYRGQQNASHLLAQNRLFRRLALGPFSDLLHAIIHDPAMLAYLNNNVSRRQRPNENLARELMERFSLGVGNYTERDVKEGARALTGYTFHGDEFHFREDWHDGDTKTILGARGQLDGDDFVGAILRRRACARFIAFKLYRFFVADIPDDPARAPDHAARVIDSLARSIRAHQYDLRPGLRTLFLSEHFYDPALAGAKVKSPADLVVGAARSLGARAAPSHALVRQMGRMGQLVFLPPSVAGWDSGRAWINMSTLYLRQNTLTFMLAGGPNARRRGQRDGQDAGSDPRALFPRESEQGARPFARALLAHALGSAGDPATEAGASRLRTLNEFFAGEGDRLTRGTAVGAVALVSAMPEFQLC